MTVAITPEIAHGAYASHVRKAQTATTQSPSYLNHGPENVGALHRDPPAGRRPIGRVGTGGPSDMPALERVFLSSPAEYLHCIAIPASCRFTQQRRHGKPHARGRSGRGETRRRADVPRGKPHAKMTARLLHLNQNRHASLTAANGLRISLLLFLYREI